MVYYKTPTKLYAYITRAVVGFFVEPAQKGRHKDCDPAAVAALANFSRRFYLTLTSFSRYIDIGRCGMSANKTTVHLIMGRVIKNGLDLLGTGRTIDLDPEFKNEIYSLEKTAEQQKVSPRERKHVKAVKLWAEGETSKACDVWEDILVDNPLDMLALKFAHDSYFYLAYHPQMRDGIARSLDINRHDAWATHAMAHVFEMGGRQDEGLQFMSATENDWNVCGMIACHDYWHYALYNVEKGNYSDAVGLYDTQVGPLAAKSGAMLDMVDACSLLYRLQLEGVNVGDRYKDIQDVCKQHLDDHVLAFNDAHFMMSCIGAGDKVSTGKLLESMRSFVKNGKGYNCDITTEVGLALCEALVSYDNGDFAKAVDLVSPVRYQVIKIGGSHAQRDIFNQFVIHCAMKSDTEEHKKLARQLLVERKCLKENSPLTDRLMAKAMVHHTG
ncbi:hypothetical protein AM593_03832, partial [Mytilus galloprovincialis]